MGDAENSLEIGGRSGGRLSITLAERGVGQGSGDVRLRVQVSSIGFKGDYDGVWIMASVIASFIDELMILERDRRGTATLTSMSPGDFSLQLRTVDSSGHTTASGFLGRCYAYPRAVEARVGFDIEVEPDRLPHLLREARRLLISSPG
jgi:hypothetical protein